jgi:hypothetical protein
VGIEQVSRSGWSRALGRGTYGGFVVGEDGQELFRTLYRQVRRLLARRAAFPPFDGQFELHATPHRLGGHSTTEGHLGVSLLMRVGLSWV